MPNDIFQQRSSRGSSGEELSRLLSMVSVMLVILIAMNFDRITAKIAIGIVDILTGGIPIVAILILIVVVLTRFTWKMRRSFWGW